MRVSLAFSFAAHTALLIASVVALPAATPFRVDEPPPVPVDILTLDEFTKLTSKKTEKEVDKPVAKPLRIDLDKVVAKPKPQPKAPPKVVEPVTPVKPVEPKTVATVIEQLPEPEPVVVPKPAPIAEPAAPEPEPVAEPLPEPEPEPIAQPAPKTKVEPKKPVAKSKAPPSPRVKPRPPKRTVAKKKPRKPKPKVVKKKPKPKFDADRIAALLNKLPGDPQEAPTETSGRSQKSTLRVAGLDQLVTRSEMDYVRRQIERCWSPPVGIEGAENLAVKVKLNLRRDGSLAAAPIVLNTGAAGFDVAADAAVRAVNECAPFDLPGENTDAWADVTINFDPRIMLGG